jgi:hypothetical protein
MLMIAPCGREVRNLPVQNYRWHLLTRPSFQQPLLNPLLDAEYGAATFAAAVWLVWALFQNSEAVMEVIGKSGKTKTEEPRKI